MQMVPGQFMHYPREARPVIWPEGVAVRRLLLLVMLCFGLMAGCSAPQPEIRYAPATVLVPVTVEVPVTIASTLTLEPSLATKPILTATAALATEPYPSATACVYAMQWVSDVTIPDDTVMQPGETFVKTWKVRNSGTCVWQDGVQLKHTTGAGLGIDETAEVELALPGEEVEVSVPMKAPSQPGTYESIWNLCKKDECAKGYVLVRIVVPAPTSMPASPVVQSAAPQQVSDPCAYVASQKSEVFHRASCSYVARIKAENRICFASREEAIASGRRPCKRCKP